jgi:hypothetical protein
VIQGVAVGKRGNRRGCDAGRDSAGMSIAPLSAPTFLLQHFNRFELHVVRLFVIFFDRKRVTWYF